MCVCWTYSVGWHSLFWHRYYFHFGLFNQIGSNFKRIFTGSSFQLNKNNSQLIGVQKLPLHSKTPQRKNRATNIHNECQEVRRSDCNCNQLQCRHPWCIGRFWTRPVAHCACSTKKLVRSSKQTNMTPIHTKKKTGMLHIHGVDSSKRTEWILTITWTLLNTTCHTLLMISCSRAMSFLHYE